jgi:hypothetical protein
VLFSAAHRLPTGIKPEWLPAPGFSGWLSRKSPFTPDSDRDFLWPATTILKDVHADSGRARGQKMDPQGSWRSLLFKPRRPEKYGPTSALFYRQLQAT